MTWSQKPSRVPSVKDELLVKLYALEHVDAAALREQLEVRLDHHRAYLAAYLKIKERFYDGKTLSRTEKGKLIALTMGISNEKELCNSFEQAVIMLGQIED